MVRGVILLFLLIVLNQVYHVSCITCTLYRITLARRCRGITRPVPNIRTLESGICSMIKGIHF